MDQRFICEEAGIVDQKLGGEIIHTVDNDIVVVENLERVASGESLFVHRDGHIGVQRLDFFFAREHLGASHIGSMMQHLALQVGQIHHIAVDQSDRPDARGSQIQRCR